MLFVIVATAINAQKPQAKSILNQKAPPLNIEKWVGEKPEMQGKWVIVDFWATWCMPCRGAIRDLNDFHELYHDKVVIIGLSHEDIPTIQKMKFPVLDYYVASDTQARMKTSLEVTGIPYALLLDPNGIVRWEGNPLDPNNRLNEDLIESFINK